MRIARHNPAVTYSHRREIVFLNQITGDSYTGSTAFKLSSVRYAHGKRRTAGQTCAQRTLRRLCTNVMCFDLVACTLAALLPRRCWRKGVRCVKPSCHMPMSQWPVACSGVYSFS